MALLNKLKFTFFFKYRDTRNDASYFLIDTNNYT